MPRIGRALLLAVVTGALLGVGAVLPGALPAESTANEVNSPCIVNLAGRVAYDPVTGQRVQCAPGTGGLRWRAMNGGITTGGGTALDGAAVGSSVLTATTPTTRPIGAGRAAAGGRCSRPGDQTISPATGQHLVCNPGTGGATWGVSPRGNQPAPPVNTTTTVPGSNPGPDTDPLDPDLGNPSGLPPGVALPPGTVQRPDSPKRLPPDDPAKLARFQIQASVPGTDPEVIHQWFVAQCAGIGWPHEDVIDQRMPAGVTPNPYFRRADTMVIGECRTAVGDPVNPWGKRPWYLQWSVTRRAGSGSLDLMVELRARSFTGARP